MSIPHYVQSVKMSQMMDYGLMWPMISEVAKVSNSNKCDILTFSLYYVAKPIITNSLPKMITFDIYDLVTLNCNVTGYPEPKIVWLHNSSVVSQTDKVLLLSNGSLVLREAVMSDAGLYVCTASSNNHHVSISVTLKHKKLG